MVIYSFRGRGVEFSFFFTEEKESVRTRITSAIKLCLSFNGRGIQTVCGGSKGRHKYWSRDEPRYRREKTINKYNYDYSVIKLKKKKNFIIR